MGLSCTQRKKLSNMHVGQKILKRLSAKPALSPWGNSTTHPIISQKMQAQDYKLLATELCAFRGEKEKLGSLILQMWQCIFQLTIGGSEILNKLN